MTTIAEACAKHLHELPSRASELEPSVPARLDDLLGKLLEKDPAARPESMKSVARAFDEIDRQAVGLASTMSVEALATPSATLPPQSAMLPSPRANRTAIAIAAGGVAAAAGVATFLLVRSPEHAAPPAPKPVDAAIAVDAAPDAAPIADAPLVDAVSPVDAAVAKPPKPAPHPAPKPPVLDQKTIHEVMYAHADQLKLCYQARKLKTLEGRLVVHMTIGLDGKVAKATAEGLTKPLQRCVLAVVNGLEFPRPHDKPQDVDYPLDFQTAGETAPAGGQTPKQPNRDRIVAAVQTATQSCKGAKGPAQVALQIAPDGSVKQLTVQGLMTNPAHDCVTRAVHALKFEKSTEGVRIEFPLVLQ